MIKRYAVEISMEALHPETTPDEIERLGFAVLDELVDAPGVIDADLLGNMAARRISYHFLVDAADSVAALAFAGSVMHTALERAEKTTEGLAITTDTREAALAG